jgi:hypothetical protein
LAGRGLMNRGNSPGARFCGILPKKGGRGSLEKGEKGRVGKPLICEVMERRRWISEMLATELMRWP